MEEILEPQRPICDPHHHLWDHPGRRYLHRRAAGGHRQRPQRGGHGVRGVHVHVPRERPAGDAAGRRDRVRQRRRRDECERRLRIDAGRRRHRELRRPCASASESAPCWMGTWRPARGSAASATPPAGTPATRSATRTRIRRPASTPTPRFRRGFAELAPRGLSFDAWLYHPQLPELTEPGQGLPRHDDHPRSLRRAPRHRALRRAAGRGLRRVEGSDPRARRLPQRGGQARRPRHAAQRLRLPQAGAADRLGRAGRGHARLVPAHHRVLRRGALHVREQLPGGQGQLSYRVLWNSFKRIAAGFSAAERSALFHDTAVRVYRLT